MLSSHYHDRKKAEPGTRRKANVLSGNFLYAVIYRFNILLKEILHQPESSNDCDCLNCLASYCPSTVHKTKKRMDVVSCGVMSFSLDRWSFCFWSPTALSFPVCLVNLFQWRAIVAQQIVHLGVGGIALETAYHANSAQFLTAISPAFVLRINHDCKNQSHSTDEVSCWILWILMVESRWDIEMLISASPFC